LSFERLYGRVISGQNLLAFMVAGKFDHWITRVVQEAAVSAALLSMGF
jgi:hypothetical protein